MTKFTSLALILALVVVASCKKSSSSSTPSGGTITATVDGTPMTFNNVLIAKDTAYGGAYVMTFGGATSLTASTTELALTVDGTDPITTGTYNIGPSGMTTNLPGITFSQGSTLVYASDASPANPCSVTITAITKTNVQGTFTGTLTLVLGTGATTKAVTNGKFNVNFK